MATDPDPDGPRPKEFGVPGNDFGALGNGFPSRSPDEFSEQTRSLVVNYPKIVL
jgi:hypothetical protein